MKFVTSLVTLVCLVIGGSQGLAAAQFDPTNKASNITLCYGDMVASLGTPCSPSQVVFTPLHLYYIAATSCNDTNPGTQASPWCTPNHNVVCGDVLVAAAGDYSANDGFTNWGTVSGCPSTTGGIDGAGGVYFAVLLCGGSDLGTGGCHMNCTASGSNPNMVSSCNVGSCGACASAFEMQSNNWAVEGWTSNAGGTTGYNVIVDACASGTTIIHHNAFINNVFYNSADGIGNTDCGMNTNIPGNGTDYFAAIGNITQNAAQGQYNGGSVPFFCSAGIVDVAPANFDSNAGTHVLFYGNFTYATATTTCNSDQEGIMFDTWDEHAYTGLGVITNNMVWTNARFGIQLFYQAVHTSPVNNQQVLNNTLFGNDALVAGIFSAGEINIQSSASDMSDTANITVTNNIGRTEWATPGGGPATNGYIYGLQVGVTTGSSITIGGSGTQNIFKGLAPACQDTSCDAGNNVTSAGLSFGTNTYTDPNFTNTSDLVSNWVGVPNCTGFVTVTACMGYNANTQTLTTNTPISDLSPTAAGMSGKGYQLPSTTCSSGAANGTYPSWLKGIVYLHYNSTSGIITENGDLVTKPCGM